MLRIQDAVSEENLLQSPPGDRRIWDAMCQDYASVFCRPAKILFVGTKNGKLPPQEVLSSWVSFPGLQTVSYPTKIDSLYLQIRNLGSDPDPLVTLVREKCMTLDPKADWDIWSALQFEFEDSAPVLAALSALLQLRSHSGIFHDQFEEARVLVPGDSFLWPQTAVSTESLSEAYQRAYLEGIWSALRRHYRIDEVRPRSATESREILDPLATELNNGLTVVSSQSRRIAEAPLTVVAGLPNQFDAFSNPDRLRIEISKAAAFYDRSVGAIHFRTQPTPRATFDVFSPLPLNRNILAESPDPDSRLYLLGPWDSRNTLVERRIQTWCWDQGRDAWNHGQLVDGEQDWILFFTRLISREPGWAVRMDDVKQLIAGNAVRRPSGRAWFFWSTMSDSQLVDEARKAHIPLLYLGKKSSSGKCEFLKPNGDVMDGIKVSQLKAEPRDVVEVKWVYPEVKSPTYGFDKAAVHPDQFLLKVSSQNTREKAWALRARAFQSGERMRSVSTRRTETSPLKYFRWTDGSTQWADAVGSKEGWMDVDPRFAGMAAADAAIRGLLACGGDFKEGSASVWLSQPWDEKTLDQDQLDAHALSWGSYVLALEGAANYLRNFGFAVASVNGCGTRFPHHQQEAAVHVRSSVNPKMNPVVPGFRMTGEVLYAIGPRPAFVDAGSRILSHVRVMSNHTSRLNALTQMDVYDLIYSLMIQGKVTCIRPVGEGGIVQALGEMALWGGMGAQIRPNLPLIEIFSSAPGRFVIGILPQEAKAVETSVRSEWLTPLGLTGGEKILGLPVSKFVEERLGGGPHL